MSSVSVVTPVYNAEPSLENLYDQLMAAMGAITGQFEVTMVEDHGEYDSRNIISKLVEQEPEGSMWPTGYAVKPTGFRILSKLMH